MVLQVQYAGWKRSREGTNLLRPLDSPDCLQARFGFGFAAKETADLISVVLAVLGDLVSLERRTE